MRANFAALNEAAETAVITDPVAATQINTTLGGKILGPDLSAKMLMVFLEACKTCLPHLAEPDLKKARIFFMEKKWLPKTRKREAA